MFEAYKNLDEFFALSTPEDRELKALRESENKLEIKKLSCALAKKKFEDMTPVKVNNYIFLTPPALFHSRNTI